jgi:hypothetical protein
MGMAKCKALLRTKLWFPEMDAMVEATIKECPACLMVIKIEVREPVKSTVMPEQPWQFLAVDYLGLPNGKVLFVITEKYSRYPIGLECESTAAKHITPKLEELFGAWGVPTEITSDNGPPFNGADFAEFLRRENV